MVWAAPAVALRYAGSCGALLGVGFRARRRRLAIFPPLVVGAMKDAVGTYTIGFVGLLVFTLACLGVAERLRRTTANA